MKQKYHSIFAKASMLPTALGTVALTLSSAHAVDIFKNDTNLTGLLDPLSWVGGVAPGASDVAVWDSTVSSADQSALPGLGANTTFAGIRIANPFSNVGLSVNNGRALSTGADGINMSGATVDLTIGGAGIVRPVSTVTANNTDYYVTSGRTLNLNATFQSTQNTTTVEFPGAGAVNINKLAATTALVLSNNGTGTLTLGGAGTSSTTGFNASGGATGAKNIINGPTITLTALGTYGSNVGAASFDLQAGAVNFNAGVRITGGVDGSLIKVSGGAFTATTTVNIGRTSNLGFGSNAPANSGFVVTGGTASMGSLLVGTSNSSATALVDGGMVTVTDTIVLGNTTNTRWNTLQVNSGSLTVSGLSGIQISTNTTVANSSQVRLTGGTTTTEAINFGVAASVAGSQGNVEVGSGATLYVGSGSVNLVSLNSYTTNFTANGGTIGAKATWATTVPVAINATSTFKAADAADAPFDITLNGGVSGAGGLTKTGSGTLTLGVVAPSYSGDTTVSAGTLSLAQPNGNNESSTVSIASGAFLNLNFIGTDTVDKLFINGVQQPMGVYEAEGNPGSDTETARITGTGTLTVSSSPPASGFGTWINGTFANGNTVPGDKQGPNDDPDNDGIDNLTEYAVEALDPTVGNGSVGTFTGLTLSFAKRQPLASDITYSIVQSTDLGISDVWAGVTGAPPVYVNDDETISYTLPGGPPKDFIRLKVEQN